MEAIEKIFDIMRYGAENYHKLMRNKVNRILMVSSVYDAFTFEKDGKLSDRLYGEFRKLDLSSNPEFVNVSTAAQAIDAIKHESFDLVITLLRIGSMSVFDFSKKVKQIAPDLSLVLLLNIPSDVTIVERNRNQMSAIDEVYLWNGDINLFLAIIKQIEDRLNFENDFSICDIPMILLVEDSIAYYSKFLPLLYSEIMQQTQRLIKSELDDLQKRYHMKARAKVLMVHNYEDAVSIFEKYKKQLFLVISDVRYPKSGEICKDAGLQLIRKVKDMGLDIPCILQSSEENNRSLASELSVSFLNKHSQTLLIDLRFVLVEYLGYGDFVFRNYHREECQRAGKISDFISILNEVNDECIRYHAERNHFSRWFTAHGFLQMAQELKKKRLSDFSCMEEVRVYLKDIYSNVYRSRFRGKVIQYDEKNISRKNQVMLLTEGSFGGKGRGITFLNALVAAVRRESDVHDFEIVIPSTYIIGTDGMVEFTQKNGYPDMDDEIEKEKYFTNSELPDVLNDRLYAIVERIHNPLVVRSSGLLEDTLSIPVSGLYETVFVSNSNKDIRVRFEELKQAVRKVYHSLYRKDAQDFLRTVNYLMQNESMAVIIQEAAGSGKCGYYFPDVSGILRSPFYEQTQTPSVSLCQGFGTAFESQQAFHSCISDSGRADSCKLKFSPDYTASQRLISVVNTKDHCIEENDIYEFFRGLKDSGQCSGISEVYKRIEEVYDDLIGTMTLYSGLIENFLQTSVEIEFSLELANDPNKRNKIYLLQIKPFSRIQHKLNDFSMKNYDIKPDILITNCYGHGIIDNINTIVLHKIIPENVEEAWMLVEELAEINSEMKKIDEEYIFIGIGKWGGRLKDRSIPANALNISHARVFINILEEVDSSFYFTHFFYNLNVLDTVYMQTVPQPRKDVINIEKIKENSYTDELKFFDIIRISGEPRIIMNGRDSTFKFYSNLS